MRRDNTAQNARGAVQDQISELLHLVINANVFFNCF